MSVYIANFGRENYAWLECLRRSTVATMNESQAHQCWLNGDRDGYIEFRIRDAKTASGTTPPRQVASRWFNLMTIVANSNNDIWIHRADDDIWWTVSQDNEPVYEAGINPDRISIVTCHKPCLRWSNKNKIGNRLTWGGLHPKATDFLSTEATLQSLSPDYAEYAEALINGNNLTKWHDSGVWRRKATYSYRTRQHGKTFNGPERSAVAMSDQAYSTTQNSNGQIVNRTAKDKQLRFRDKYELEKYLLTMIKLQEGLCAITGIPMQFHGEQEDPELLCSLDRIDSTGHYEAGNLQVVCRFINRWKCDSIDSEFRRLVCVLRSTASDKTISDV